MCNLGSQRVLFLIVAVPFTPAVFLWQADFAERRRNIADSVASLLSLQAPTAVALMEVGVSKSILLRTIACAWDWLEKIPCSDIVSRTDEYLMSLALLRLSVNFELAGEHRELALKLLGAAGDKPALLALECRLVMRMGRGMPDN